MFLVAVVLLLLPIVLLTIVKRAFSKNIKLPPSPPALPLIGNLHQLGSLPHRSLYDLSKKHGPLMHLQLGQVPALVVSSAEAARDIMRTHDAVFASRPPVKVARILLFGGLDVAFAPYGEYWRQLRKICINHLLGAKMVPSFRGVREEEVASMISEVLASPCPVDMSKVLNLFANNVLCRAVFGKSFRGEAKNIIFCQLTEENLILLGKFFVEDSFPSLGWLDTVLGLEGRARKAAKGWDLLLDEIIDERANRLRDQDLEPETQSFVDVLLSLQNDTTAEFALDRELIKILILDMLAAGTDTTFITLEWGMTELIRNSEVMRKLQDEIRGMANRGSMVSEADLSRMSYLKAVVKEVLRLHPPAPLLVPRESMETCQIQGYEIPARTRVIVNGWAIGRDPKFWDEPEKFQPERFLCSNIDFKVHDFQFIPFGAGRRICPGMQFAVSNLELAFANLVHQFDWELPDGMEIQDLDMAEAPGMTTRKKEKLRLVAKPVSHRRLSTSNILQVTCNLQLLSVLEATSLLLSGKRILKGLLAIL